MNWHELDALFDRLRSSVRLGAFNRLGSIDAGCGYTMNAELLARITLADIDHLKELERFQNVSALRLVDRWQGLADDARRLLDLVEPQEPCETTL